MGGVTCSFSEYDLHATASAYSAVRRKAPLVLGHPTNDLPALGEVHELVAKDGLLYAVAEFSESLVQAVRSGAYKFVSAKFVAAASEGIQAPGLWCLRHVGFLGAVAPAVKGLGSVEFSEPVKNVSFGSAEYLAFAEASKAELSFSVPSGYSMDSGRLRLHERAFSVQQSIPETSYLQALRIVNA